MVDEIRPDGPDKSVSAAIDGAAGSLLSVWMSAQETAAAQLSSAQLRALMVVEQYDGVNLRGLAAAMGILLSSASRLCDRLVAAGVLEREPGRVDRREIALHLTPAGRKLLDELRAERRGVIESVLSRMSPAGRQALLRGLQEFAAVAGASEDVAARTA